MMSASKGVGMKVAVVALGLLASIAILSTIPANDFWPRANGGFSMWAQAQQQTGYCECLNANTRGISCISITSCLPIGECQRVCPKPQ